MCDIAFQCAIFIVENLQYDIERCNKSLQTNQNLLRVSAGCTLRKEINIELQPGSQLTGLSQCPQDHQAHIAICVVFCFDNNYLTVFYAV